MKKFGFMPLMLLSLFTLSSFAFIYNKGIPEDFDARKCILLIEDSPNDKRSDKMEVIMKELYPYKYEIVNKDVRGIGRDQKYADKELYRYILGNDERLVTTSEGHNISFEIYSIYDRKDDKNYPVIRAGNNYSAGSFKHDIKVLVKYMSKLK